MKRLVYSPQINVWIKTDTGVFDLSPYITGFNVNRKVNAVSTAELTFRNPKVDLENGESRYLFTQHKNGDSYGPMFHPMDPIIITLTRIKGYPVQVFTGYCDTSPYVQIFPGTARLKASCSLKKLLYTYWDPGLPFVNEYLIQHGWYLKDGVTFNPKAEADKEPNADTNYRNTLSDGSIGYLLYSILKDVGGWAHDDIFIQSLPSKQIDAIVEGLYKDLTGEAKASFEQMRTFLKKTIGADHHLGGGGGDTTDVSNPPPGGGGQPASVGYPLAINGENIGGSNVPGSTHDPNVAPNNWQSDNAMDIGVPVGTSVFAVDDGTITTVRGYYTDGTGRFEGLRFTLETADNKWFYQHNSQRFVHEGQKVKKGDLLAKTGSGNGVPHLHIGCQNGKPEKLLGWE